MAGKRISGIEDDVLILAGISVGGYLLYEHFFGGPSQGESNQVNEILTAADYDNPFSHNYRYSLYAQQPTIYNLQWWINLSQMYAQISNSGQNPATVSGVYNYVLWGELITQSFGLISIDFNTIQSVMQQVRSQADVSNIACYLYFTQGIELYNLLFDGSGSGLTITSGLGAANLAAIVKEVKALPESN